MDVDSGHDAEFAQETQSFLQWFQALLGATFHPNIKIVDLRGQDAGRGIIATADIEPDTVLFTIPRVSILCAATSDLAAKIPDIFTPQPTATDDEESGDEDENTGSQDPWTLLILVLVYEYLQGSASRWKPYLDILPSTFDTPMFWQPSELAELEASAVVAKVGKEDADKMIRSKIFTVVRAHEDVFFPASTPKPNDDELLNLAHRMGSAIMAYAFDLEKEDDDDEEDEETEDEWIEDREGKTMMGMVPMADMLNADAKFNAHINHSEAALTATALRAICAGEEILNYYGPLSNGELLRRYGYVTPKHARYDVVELPWSLVEKRMAEHLHLDSKVSAKVAEYLADAGEELEDSFVLERSSPDPSSAGLLEGKAEFTGLPEDMSEQVMVYLKAVKKAYGGVDEARAEALADRDTRNEIYLTAVTYALKDREGQYATPLARDNELIGNADKPRGRREMALWVRRGEKQLLQEAQAWVSEELNKLQQKKAADKRPREGNDRPDAKRRRA
ncbi:hypothetical protein B0H63DRAFT_477192 [Podospora didyma]|uniref:SET domain-containing protein n=1 Tax=Podospora didyma TaxID=330526 RepID=A0AAE0KJH5_9PEZI|nr:hypothetical protein B0H63DRAFT_477192 [Podospora didyma]